MNTIANRPGINILNNEELQEFGDQIGGGYGYGAYIIGGFVVYRFGLILDSFLQGAGANTLALVVGEAMSGLTRAACLAIARTARGIGGGDIHNGRGRFWNNLAFDLAHGVSLSSISGFINSGHYNSDSHSMV